MCARLLRRFRDGVAPVTGDVSVRVPATRERFDVVIVGAGVAGLSLLRHLLAEGPATRTIAVIDEGDRRDHNLAFGEGEGEALALPVEARWRAIRAIGADGEVVTRPLGEHVYERTHRRALRAASEAAAAAAGERVAWVAGRCEAIVDGPEVARARVGERWIVGGWVFDGRPPEVSVDRRRHVALWQRFEGAEVESAGPCFDPTAATLFDFRVEPAGEVRFAYVLASSPTSALVEVVAIGAREGGGLGVALDEYLGRVAPGAAIVRREGGASLLTDQPFRRALGRRVCAIGRRGGRLKPSSGYALARIERDSAAIVASLARTGRPFALPRERAFLRFLDAILLQVLARRPERGAAIFTGLVRRCPGDRLLRFLDERATLGDLVAVIRAVRSWVFVAAIVRWVVVRAAAALGWRGRIGA